MSDLTITPDEEVRRREVALQQAVNLHGMANNARNALPAKTGTVLETARLFAAFIATGAINTSR